MVLVLVVLVPLLNFVLNFFHVLALLLPLLLLDRPVHARAAAPVVALLVVLLALLVLLVVDLLVVDPDPDFAQRQQ